MRVNRTTRENVHANKFTKFISDTESFLHKRLNAIISRRNIPDKVIREMIEETYNWTVKNHKPSQLLTLRLSCAKICLGSFFMEDPRHKKLHQIIQSQLSQTLLDSSDPIIHYLNQNEAYFKSDPIEIRRSLIRGFIDNNDITWSLNRGFQYYKNALMKLVRNDARKFYALDNVELFIEQLLHMSKSQLSSVADEEEVFLLALGQFYYGYRCHEDPLMPDWFNIIEDGRFQKYVFEARHKVYFSKIDPITQPNYSGFNVNI